MVWHTDSASVGYVGVRRCSGAWLDAGLGLCDWEVDMNSKVNKYDTESLKIYVPSPPVGGYRMGDEANGGWVLFNLPKKPCWAHRVGVRLVLGWKWVDA